MENLNNLNSEKKINCIPQETVIKNVRLAHAYVPIQNICETYTPIESLIQGTAFPELIFKQRNWRNVDE